MTIEEMRERKRELGYSYEMLSEKSGVPLGTVQKVLGGVTHSPRYDTILALERALSEPLCVRDSGNRDVSAADGVRGPMGAYAVSLSDPAPAQKPDGYTLADYYALPDEKRVELIDGKFYDMAAPNGIHQILVGSIHAAFFNYIRSNQGTCIPFLSPTDVQLDQDNRTMVQPDVLILCDRSKFKGKVIFGAPDLVVEILSKSTKNKDLIIKLNKYYSAGVREYWIVDPAEQTIGVYRFHGEEELKYQAYDRSSKVPVGIFDGKCEVDFGEIFGYLDSLEGMF